MATNTYSGLNMALRQGVKNSPLALPYAVPNAPFNKPSNQSPWASVFIMGNQPSVATLGNKGQNAHNGILQINLNYPLNTGKAAVTAKANKLTNYFKAGKQLAHSGVKLTVASCGRSRGRKVNGWYRVSITVTWFARVSQN